jgi:hypothetical protein
VDEWKPLSAGLSFQGGDMGSLKAGQKLLILGGATLVGRVSWIVLATSSNAIETLVSELESHPMTRRALSITPD